jgi:hypothetical protein
MPQKALDKPVANFPGAQSTQIDAPLALLVPAAQAAHDADFATAENLPASQESQWSAFAAL